MESLEDGVKSKMGFFKHVFNMNDNSKADISNIVQYALIAIIPVVILNKTMQKYVPEADDEKGSFELLAEVVIQIIAMFLGLLTIHRIITYIPTYSGIKYEEFNVVYIILAVLMITLSLQTKLGEKVSILSERVYELWEGKKEDPKKKGKPGKKGAQVKVSQPIAQGMNPAFQGSGGFREGMTGMSGDSQGTFINSLPVSQQSPGEQTKQDYNSMFRNDSNPLPGAATPGYDSPMIMAANEALGGSFGSNF
jgi:hypothetical protein